MHSNAKHTSIAVQQGGGRAVQRGTLLVGDEHGHPGAILAGGKLLLSHKLWGGDITPLQLGLSEELWLCVA